MEIQTINQIEDRLRMMIDVNQQAINQMGKDLKAMKETLRRDKEDQWKIISELSKKLES